jgi:hypothetical protein
VELKMALIAIATATAGLSQTKIQSPWGGQWISKLRYQISELRAPISQVVQLCFIHGSVRMANMGFPTFTRLW